MFDEISPITHASAGAPPIFFYNSYAPGPPGDWASYVHHPKLTLVLKERLDALGVENVYKLRSDYPSWKPPYFNGHEKEWFRFCLKHFDMSKGRRKD
jgi:hypothetical protein